MSNKEGPEIKEKFIINCADCNMPLLEIIIVKDGKYDLTKLKVHCKCGGASYLIPIQGTHKMFPVEPFLFKNVENSPNKEEVWLS